MSGDGSAAGSGGGGGSSGGLNSSIDRLQLNSDDCSGRNKAVDGGGIQTASAKGESAAVLRNSRQSPTAEDRPTQGSEGAGGATEVEDDVATETPAPELLIKHPLQNSWTFWFFRNDRTKAWEENLRPVITFNTVEDFWALYNHIEDASKLTVGCDYSLFKEGIKPMWEDQRNRAGGRWLINLDKKLRSSSLDSFWLEVMLSLIGESFDDHSQYVNGAVVQVRPKGDKIGMWLSDCNVEEPVTTIGRKVKELLVIDDKVTLGFEAHQDTIHRSGSMAKNKFVV